jgi:TRAP-type C4-dicarboxylate transport system permease small subunit
LIQLFERLLGPLLAALMFLIMAAMTADVVGRYFFNAPIKGSYELIGLAMGAVIFLGLPLCTARGEHICVDLFDRWFSTRARRLAQQVTVNTLGAATFFFISWRLAIEAMNYARNNEVTMITRVPFSALAWLESVLIGIAGVMFVVRLVKALRG